MPNRKITEENPFKLCFVCLGNICRSPTAEGIMQHLVEQRSLQAFFEIDSSGTSAYHIGEAANSYSREIASRHGIELHSKSRPLESFDLDYFDLLLAMDHTNEANIQQLAGNKRIRKKIQLLREYDTGSSDKEVPDPYEGGLEGFERVFDVIQRCCENLLDELEKNISQS
jgi:protein-tyrosine phosphatase